MTPQILTLIGLSGDVLYTAVNEAVAQATDTQPRRWLLMKRGLYYRPKAAGYTNSIAEAGRFDEAYARRDVEATRGEVSMMLEPVPPYSTSADAVMPLLEQHEWFARSSNQHGKPTTWVQIRKEVYHQDPNVQPIESIYFDGNVKGFALAACIAFLRAHGWTVTL